MIQESQEGGVETKIQFYDLNLSFMNEITPYTERNVTGSSYVIKGDSYIIQLSLINMMKTVYHMPRFC
jgi:hypothetical protein